MVVLCYGMTKSGSTLAFELCKAVLEKQGYPQRRLPDSVVAAGHHINFLDEASVPGLTRLMQEVAPAEIIAVKLHLGLRRPELDFVQAQVASGALKVQVNFRDPREVCLSLIDAGASARKKQRQAFSEIESFDDAAKVVTRQLNICRIWGSIVGAMHLYYNDVAFDSGAVIKRMCEDFGFEPLDAAASAEVFAAVAKDAFTQRNKAVKDRYKDELTVRQNEELLENYPLFRAFIRKICEQRRYSWFTKAERQLKTQ